MIDPRIDAATAALLADLHGALSSVYRRAAEAPTVKVVRVTAGPPDLARTGLIAWVTVDVGPVRLDGIAVRRTSGGRLVVSYPTRRDSRGIQHPIVLPLGEDAELEIERQILKALNLDAEDGR